MIFEIFPVHNVAGKLADASLRFEAGEPLNGFTLAGFQIWEAGFKNNPDRSITFPARTWRMANGQDKPVVLLRDGRTDPYLEPPVTVALKAAILAAYEAQTTKGARRRALVQAGQRVAEAPVAPARVLRPRVATPVGHVAHRVAEAAAP